VLIRHAGMGMAGIALVAVPVSLVWVVNALWLGRRQERAAAAGQTQPQSQSGFAVIVPPPQR
jgi:hypothetical protein